jgi:hypothetical protein
VRVDLRGAVLNTRVIAVLCLLGLAACGGGGGSSPPAATLSYANPSQVSVIGSPITAMVPTITGTLSSFTMSPAPPNGVGITPTGIIEGTPTVLSPKTTYTVYASSPSGPVTTQVTLTITDHPPSALSYPTAAVTYTVGFPATPLAPTISGQVTGYSVSPALPPGLTLDSASGTISGTATAAAAAAPYVFTAHNSGGDASFTLQITAEDSTVLLELGHQESLTQLRFSGSRVLSVDRDGHWVLWNYDTGAMLTQGDTDCGNWNDPACVPVQNAALAGPTVVIYTTAGFQIYDSNSGSLLAKIPALVNWWALASDGSYLAAGNRSSLLAWTPTGTVLVNRPGDYSGASAFAAPAQIQVAKGPAGANVIETVAVPGGTSSIGATFNNAFSSWFAEGGRFLATAGNNVLVYSKDTVQEAAVTLPTTAGLAGAGNWFWAGDYYFGNLLVYAVGPGSSPAASYPLAGYGNLRGVVPSGTTLALVGETSSVSIIDLSGSTPTETDYATPQFAVNSFAARSATTWVTGYSTGAIFDGATLAGAPRYLGYGKCTDLVAGTDHIAVATSIGQIVLFNAHTLAQEGTIPLMASKLTASADGSVLAAIGTLDPSSSSSDKAVPVYSLPAGSPIYTWPYPNSAGIMPLDIALSPSGAHLGQDLLNPSGNTQQVSPTTGGTPILTLPSPSGNPPVLRLAADDIHFANDNGFDHETKLPAAGLYAGSNLTTAVAGWPVGWLDSGRLLVNQYVWDEFHTYTVYASCQILDPQGQVAGTCKIAQIALEVTRLQPLSQDSIYAGNLNLIVQPSTGAVTWTGGNPMVYATFGAATNGHAIFVSGASVLAQSY